MMNVSQSEKTAFDTRSVSLDEENPSQANEVSSFTNRSKDFVQKQVDELAGRGAEDIKYRLPGVGKGGGSSASKFYDGSASPSELEGMLSKSDRKSYGGTLYADIPLSSQPKEVQKRQIANYRSQKNSGPSTGLRLAGAAAPVVGAGGGYLLGKGLEKATEKNTLGTIGLTLGGLALGINGLNAAKKEIDRRQKNKKVSPKEVNPDQFIKKHSSNLGLGKVNIGLPV